MLSQVLHAPALSAVPLPAVRKIRLSDLVDALSRGVADFKAIPSHALFLGVIYPIIGLLLARATVGHNLLPLLFPLAAGFALVGPFAAIGLYELSRRRERGLNASWARAIHLFYSPARGAIFRVGALLTVIFVAWLFAADAMYKWIFGPNPPASVGQFVHDVVATPDGWKLAVVGNAVGFLFAVVAFTISVVSFPMLIDRRGSARAAVLTSVRCVAKNPGVMAAWGLIVAVALVLGALPLFVGLAVVLPVLGHATWHLYRKLVGD